MASRHAVSATHSKSKVVTSANHNGKPSAKMNPKVIDPFDKKKLKSTFACAYQSGLIPCRLMHGSVKHKLQWTTPPQLVPFDPLLVTFAEGLKELVHPYSFVAYEGFMQLLLVEDAEAKVLPLLPKLIPAFKAALMIDNEACFLSSLQALNRLSDVAGPSLNVHLKNILPQISRRMMKKNFKGRATDALQKLECNGAPEATSIIKSRVPTYSSAL